MCPSRIALCFGLTLGLAYSPFSSIAQGPVALASQAPIKATEKPKPEFPVKMEVQPEKREGNSRQRIVVTLTIVKGYHLLANPTATEFLPPGTVLTVKGNGKHEVLQITYPKGEVVKDDVIGDYLIYSGTIKLEAIVKRAKSDTESLSVAVRVQPFDDRGCLWGIRSLSKTIP